MIVPELNGKPIELTKKTSSWPNNAKVDGSRSLKINNRIDTDIILAKRKFLSVISLYFLKKYIIPIAGIVSIAIKWTPNESPIKKAINNNHLSPLTLSKSFSHLSPVQKVTDKKSIAKAYTSDSTIDDSKSNCTYITLGHLFTLIQHFGIFSEGTEGNSKPVVYLDYNPNNTIIKTPSLRASIDPSKCLIPYITTLDYQDLFFC